MHPMWENAVRCLRDLSARNEIYHPEVKMSQYEIDTERANLRAQILSAREHANRTTGDMREANLSHMNAAIVALRELNQKSK